MAKHNKKPSPSQQKKLMLAQNRKDFFKRFERIVTLVSGNPQTYNTIPAHVLNLYYEHRFLSVGVEAAGGHTVQDSILKEIKELSRHWLQNHTYTINAKGDTMSLNDYLTVGLTLFFLTNKVESSLSKSHPQLVSTVENIVNEQPEYNAAMNECVHIGQIASFLVTNMSLAYYWTDLDWVQTYIDGKLTFRAMFKVYSHIQKRKLIIIEGINHYLLRVGWGFHPNGMDWCSRESELFGLPQTGKKKLPVYIQGHALQRLQERLDCVMPDNFMFFIYLAAKEGRIIKGQSEAYLIEFQFYLKKTGYLLAKVHQGWLVIHTFLFLTHNGTPEGQKLKTLTGLCKFDKIYLSLDKLSTFVDPEIRQNETIRRLFIEAGCGDLFEITNKQLNVVDPVTGHIKAKDLVHFLMLNPVDAEAPPDFSDALANQEYHYR